jgi:CDP-6-deoxy-D-xylo-4-hexulose-3-dehydrase
MSAERARALYETTELEDRRAAILQLVAEYHELAFQPPVFVPGVSPVPVSGRVFDATELQFLVDSGLEFWLTAGRYAKAFERDFARFFGMRHAILVNSGSSANLVALSALTSPRLRDRRLQPGDEVITVAAGFPTTVNPIVQNGLIPVFVDVTLPTYNIDVSQLDAALSERTRAIMIAHTLGNPFDAIAVEAFAKKHGLWLIEDCCDAVGSTVSGRHVGTFGDLATTSFYPAHHITMGEGGSVLTNRPSLKLLVESFRDWGRDCWCEPGVADTCARRFEWQLGDLPAGYDHKYTYSHIGYNLKVTDMQAAVGVAQLEKLPRFIEARRQNYATLRAGVADLEHLFVLPEPTAGTDPSWFGFPLSVRADAPIDRNGVIARLEAARIATRLLFAGNLTRQPAYRDVQQRTPVSLANTDFVMTNTFWVGLYPGLTPPMLEHVLEVLHEVAR